MNNLSQKLYFAIYFQMNKFENVIPLIRDCVKSLHSSSGNKIEFINQVTEKKFILLSREDLNDPSIVDKKTVSVDDYFNNVLLVQAEKELTGADENMLYFNFEKFKDSIFQQIGGIEKNLAILSSIFDKQKPSTFLSDFFNGVLVDKDIFKKTLENVILNITNNNLTYNKLIERLAGQFDSQIILLQNLEKSLKDLIFQLEFTRPKMIQQIDEIVINKGKWIPNLNGIDVHPFKNIYVSSTAKGGDMVIVDLYKNKEITRICMSDYSGGYGRDNYLWSPSGQKLLVTTHDPPNALIYNENGILINAIENTHANSFGWGASWLSESVIGIGYEDGMINFFNIDELNKIGDIQLLGKKNWAMEYYDESHLLTGDEGGHLRKINWVEKKEIWSKRLHNNNHNFRIIRVFIDKTKALTGSADFYVKCILLHDCSILWEYKMNNAVQGIAFCAGETALVALSYLNQLVLLEPATGKKIIDYDKLSLNCCSLKVSKRTDEILVGDPWGKVRKLKIIY